MTRAALGIAAIIAAVASSAFMPEVLDGWSVLGWWALIAVGCVGACNVALAILDATDGGES